MRRPAVSIRRPQHENAPKVIAGKGASLEPDGQTPFRTTRLTDIPLRALTPHKVRLAHYGAQDHCRWVFRGRLAGSANPLFYKIWNPSYVRRDNILAAIESGFYDERTVPALHSVIFHNGICRGYIMHQGTARQRTVSTEFRDLVFLRTGQTGFFTVQFAPCHAMIYQDRWSLIDLEGAYPVEALPHLSRYHCEFENAAYKTFVTGLHKQLSSDSDISIQPDVLTAMARGAIAESASQEAHFEVPPLPVRLGRKLARSVRRLIPRIELIVI